MFIKTTTINKTTIFAGKKLMVKDNKTVNINHKDIDVRTLLGNNIVTITSLYD